MTKQAFVISDIHGMYDEFIELLNHWNSETSSLVLVGDLIDRGPDSLKVVRKAMELQQQHENVIVLQGNHDQMLSDSMENPKEHLSLYLNHNGGAPTLRSFVDNEFKVEGAPVSDILYFIQTYRKKEIEFLKQGHLYYEFGKVLFTHAGFCSWMERWQDTTDNQFVWIRDHYKHKNNSGFVNVFGHTPTQLINKDQSNDVWVSADKMYIAIDGACAYGGQLNGALISEHGELLETYSVESSRA